MMGFVKGLREEQSIVHIERIDKFFDDGEDGIKIGTSMGSTVIFRCSELDRLSRFKLKKKTKEYIDNGK